MKLTLIEHGGWSAPLAISRARAPRGVNSEVLPPQATQEMMRLVTAAQSAAPPKRTAPAPDEMSYTITVEDAGKTVELRQSDTAMSPAFAALLEWLQAQAP